MAVSPRGSQQTSRTNDMYKRRNRRFTRSEKDAICLLKDLAVPLHNKSHCMIEVHMPHQRHAKVSPVNILGANFTARFVHAYLTAAA